MNDDDLDDRSPHDPDRGPPPDDSDIRWPEENENDEDDDDEPWE